MVLNRRIYSFIYFSANTKYGSSRIVPVFHGLRRL